MPNHAHPFGCRGPGEKRIRPLRLQGRFRDTRAIHQWHFGHCIFITSGRTTGGMAVIAFCDTKPPCIVHSLPHLGPPAQGQGDLRPELGWQRPRFAEHEHENLSPASLRGLPRSTCSAGGT